MSRCSRRRSEIADVASQIEFELKDMESHVTNVNLFTGVQFQRYGLHYVEILLENELRLRYPVPVVKI